MTGQEKKIKISELPASVTFTGLWTLGYQFVDGKKTSVRVSLAEIQAAYDNAVSATTAASQAATSANTAAGKATAATETAVQAAALANGKAAEAGQAAQAANTAATGVNQAIQAATEATEAANAAAGSVSEAISEAETATKNAGDAAKAANDAAAEADTATQAANTAAGVANTAAALANEKAGLADTAARGANQAKQDADTATGLANQAAQAASQAATAADQARQEAETAAEEAREATIAANQAADNANTKADLADTAAQNANAATGDAETATENANAATEVTRELNAHPMKPENGYWWAWNVESKEYENTGIQAKGDVGSSFKIVGRYDTLEELQEAVPDGSDVDGVYAIGAEDPFSYYAWVVVDGVYRWDNQGQLQGAEGKSAYEVWKALPGNEGKTEADYLAWLAPGIDEETGHWTVQGQDTGKRALPFDAKVSEAEGNTDKIYKLEIETAAGTVTTPNLRGEDGERYTVPTLDHEPGETDLTWTADGVAHAFEIGYMCRWLDPDRGEAGEYLFYQLNDITADGKAVWKRAGSGGGDGETVTLTLSTSDDRPELLTGLKVTLRYGNVTTELDWGGEPIAFTVPATQYYWVEYPAVEGYRAPATLHYTAGAGTVREIAAEYGLITVSGLIFDRATALPANITGDVSQGVYKGMIDSCRRCLAKPEADGVAICYLNDLDTTQYHDGTGAALDGSEGDVMVLLPGSYLRRVKPDVDHTRYDIARDDPRGDFLLHDTDSLVGAYKASLGEDGSLRSVSGATPVTDIGRYDLHAKAALRGEGFRLIDFRQHCTLALLCYAKFGTRDIRGVIGAGTATWNADNLTGSTNALGNGDTSGDAAGYVSALGVEGIIGGVSELMDGVEALDYLWRIERADGTTDEVAACRSTGWIAAMAFEEGPRFDMVPTLVGGSSSAYFADFYECADNDTVPMAVARACFTNREFPDDGAGYANATLTHYNGSPFFGTRLAYRGKIRVVESVAEFKAI